MKANLPQTEPIRISEWLKSGTYKKMVDRNKGRTKFVMPDGPPYANGNIHVGHVLNKVLKDVIIKYQNMAGRYAAFIPGWDCHGLPIELNVTKKLGPKRHSTSDSELRKMCRAEALSWVEKQRVQFQRLGVLADWDRPYLTLSPDYEAEEVRVLADVFDNGILYRGNKPVYWDPALQTALAAAEVEYHNHKSPSIYVKFAVPGGVPAFAGEKNVNFVIWTTTPWTLPANYGIAVHKDFEYGLFVAGKDHLIVAKDLKATVEKAIGLELKLKSTAKGSDLEGVRARHPFLDRDSLVVLGDHVTLDAGTGCVHTAPGHGVDDYTVGLKYGLPVESPVDEAGKFQPGLDGLSGLSIWEGNSIIVDQLTQSGHLLGFSEIEHQYPYGPRSKKPLIFRATPQWFIRLDDDAYNVRKKALQFVETEIEFVPEWGIQRLTAMISNSPDWCLSRQRIWGVPIPVFYCEECKEPLVHSGVMRKVADKMEQTGEGIEAYFSHPESEFTNGQSCSCGGTQFTRGKDILDVWFDSGVCHAAVQRRREELAFPADIYIEGSDQHRGWFQTSLMSSVASNGRPPYKTLITHGFVNDAQGYKMSKSLGNVVDPAEVMKDFGAEILRLWVAHEDYGDDLTISKDMLGRISETYRRFRNTIRFLLGNLSDFEPEKHTVPVQDMPEIDRWALARLNDLVEKCGAAYESFEFHKVYHALNNFFTIDLSSVYLDVLKDRLYTSRKDGIRRRSSQTVFVELLDNLCRLMAPIATFLAEETYQYVPGRTAESVLCVDFPQRRNEWDNPELLKNFSVLLEVRSELSKILEDLRRQKVIGSGLDASIVISAGGETYAMLEKYQPVLKELFIVSRVELKRAEKLSIVADRAPGEKCVRCWHYDKQTDKDGRWPGLCPKCIEALK